MGFRQTAINSERLSSSGYDALGRLVLTFAVLTLLPYVGRAGPVTFRHVLELASQRQDIAKGSFAGYEPAREDCYGVSNPYLEAMAFSAALDRSLDFKPFTAARRFDSPVQSSFPSLSASSVFTPRATTTVVLCAAVAYLELVKVKSQTQVLGHQEKAAARLLRIETLRVRNDVDEPGAITRAKLVLARARLWAVELQSSSQRARARLARITGLPEEDLQVVTASVPPLSSLRTSDFRLEEAMKQLAAIRDMAQLELALARANRNRMRVRNVLASSNLPDLVAAYIIEDDSFNCLLETHFQVERIQLEVLERNGELNKWMSTWPDMNMATTDAIKIGTTPYPLLESSASSTQGPATAPAVRSIMLVPALGSLKVGESRQYSLVATYTTGTAKEVTLEADWRCSSDWDAVVSSTGMVTALSMSHVTISASIGGKSESRLIEIIADDIEPF